MSTVNCVSGAMAGDFIHQLDAARNIAVKHGPVNLYLSDAHGGDFWKYGAKKAYEDMYGIIKAQPYIKEFYLFEQGMDIGEYINLNDWRPIVATTHAETGKYDKCWSELMCSVFNYQPNPEYAWLIGETYDFNTKGAIVIHRSKHRHNGSFPWELVKLSCLSNDKELIFVTCDVAEWQQFEYKTDVRPYIVKDITEMANAIWSSDGFVGNQSAPLAIASALDKMRICELDADPAPFYMGEEQYSQNITWFLNNEINNL